MSIKELDQIRDDASILLNRLDKYGYIFDSSDDDLINKRIVRTIDENKMDIISILYNIINIEEGDAC